MKEFAELKTIKYILAHALYGEYNFKEKEVYLICDNGLQVRIANLAGDQLVQILIPAALVENYLESDVNKVFPILGYDTDAAGNLTAYLEGIELDDVKFIQMIDAWANNKK